MADITSKQSATLEGIENWMGITGRAPTVSELADKLGIERTVLNARLDGLERSGYLKPRSVGDKRSIPLELTLPGLRSVGAAIPLLGQIRGGPLSEALAEPEGLLHLPHAVKGAQQQFALRVVGDSMSEVICDSDVVVLEIPSREPRPGEITAVQIANDTTLKYFYLLGQDVSLRSHNPAFEPITMPLEEIEVLGLYVGSMSHRIAAMLLK